MSSPQLTQRKNKVCRLGWEAWKTLIYIHYISMDMDLDQTFAHIQARGFNMECVQTSPPRSLSISALLHENRHVSLEIPPANKLFGNPARNSFCVV